LLDALALLVRARRGNPSPPLFHQSSFFNGHLLTPFSSVFLSVIRAPALPSVLSPSTTRLAYQITRQRLRYSPHSPQVRPRRTPHRTMQHTPQYGGHRCTPLALLNHFACRDFRHGDLTCNTNAMLCVASAGATLGRQYAQETTSTQCARCSFRKFTDRSKWPGQGGQFGIIEAGGF